MYTTVNTYLYGSEYEMSMEMERTYRRGKMNACHLDLCIRPWLGYDSIQVLCVTSDVLLSLSTTLELFHKTDLNIDLT